MGDHPGSFLLDNPELVTASAPWCTTFDNLELGILLLSQPWLAGDGLRRAELERQLTQLAHDLPLGAVYFQRVKRSVARLEAIGAVRGIGAGRSRRFLGTPCGFASLILNLRILRLDPTTDGSEFELKRALVAMWNLVFDRLSELPDEPALDSELESFFDDVQALKVLGKPAITDELVRDALDILGLIELQRERVAQLLEQSERRLEQLPSRANLFRSVDLAQLIHDPAAATAVRSLATSELPELNLRATAMCYQHYLTYLDELTKMYAQTLRVVNLDVMRQLAGRLG